MQGIPADLSTLGGRQELIAEVSKRYGGDLHILGWHTRITALVQCLLFW